MVKDKTPADEPILDGIKCKMQRGSVVSLEWCELSRCVSLCGSCKHNADNRKASKYQDWNSKKK
jgi:hypothetical protein